MSMRPQPDGLAAGYEALRAEAVGSLPSDAPRGRALVLGQGLPAWIRGLGGPGRRCAAAVCSLPRRYRWAHRGGGAPAHRDGPRCSADAGGVVMSAESHRKVAATHLARAAGILLGSTTNLLVRVPIQSGGRSSHTRMTLAVGSSALANGAASAA